MRVKFLCKIWRSSLGSVGLSSPPVSILISMEATSGKQLWSTLVLQVLLALSNHMIVRKLTANRLESCMHWRRLSNCLLVCKWHKRRHRQGERSQAHLRSATLWTGSRSIDPVALWTWGEDAAATPNREAASEDEKGKWRSGGVERDVYSCK